MAHPAHWRPSRLHHVGRIPGESARRGEIRRRPNCRCYRARECDLTVYHAKYFAHELTKRCASDSVEKLATALSNAQVDLNPHQIEAALFAFRSPLSKACGRFSAADYEAFVLASASCVLPVVQMP